MGRPRAAVSISAPAFRMDDGKLAEVAKVVVRAASDLSQELGYRGDEKNLALAAARGV